MGKSKVVIFWCNKHNKHHAHIFSPNKTQLICLKKGCWNKTNNPSLPDEMYMLSKEEQENFEYV
jgi:hypothetical protein